MRRPALGAAAEGRARPSRPVPAPYETTVDGHAGKATKLEHCVAAHYGRNGLTEAILEGLRATGAAMDALVPADLAPVDAIHTAGRAATRKALDMLPLQPGMHVLDAGCGIGGTARCLAQEYGCWVTGVDLTPEYVETARALTQWVGLTGACSFHQGSVVDMPFAAGQFDAAVSFHVAMNVEDRFGFYHELARVLRPGAPLCVLDVMTGRRPGMRYPVPWAETAATSFLKSRAETCDLLFDTGFELVAQESLRGVAIDFCRALVADGVAAGGPPPLAPHLLSGADAPEAFSNYLAACEAHQVEPVLVLAERC